MIAELYVLGAPVKGRDITIYPSSGGADSVHPPRAGRSETSQKMGVGEGTVGQRCNGHPRTTLRLGSTVTLIGGHEPDVPFMIVHRATPEISVFPGICLLSAQYANSSNRASDN